MYNTIVDNTSRIKVTTAKHDTEYALDGSLFNPLEAFYASLAACAAVYAKKACKGLGTTAEGIEIACKPFAGPGGPLTLAKFKPDRPAPDHPAAPGAPRPAPAPAGGPMSTGCVKSRKARRTTTGR